MCFYCSNNIEHLVTAYLQSDKVIAKRNFCSRKCFYDYHEINPDFEQISFSEYRRIERNIDTANSQKFQEAQKQNERRTENLNISLIERYQSNLISEKGQSTLHISNTSKFAIRLKNRKYYVVSFRRVFGFFWFRTTSELNAVNCKYSFPYWMNCFFVDSYEMYWSKKEAIGGMCLIAYISERKNENK